MHAAAKQSATNGSCHVAATDDHDVGGIDPGNTTQEHSSAASRPLEEMGPDLNAHLAGDLALGGEDGPLALGVLDHLVTDERDLPLDQLVDELAGRDGK